MLRHEGFYFVGLGDKTVMVKIKDHSLYLVITEECGLGRGAVEIAKLAISGGVDIIQMREKNKPANEMLRLACELADLCKEKQVTFIVNDDPLLAQKSRASGVHLGQEDLRKYNAAETRKIIGSRGLIGVSTHSLLELKEANEDDNIDYIAFGPIFPTKTKNYFLGTKDVKKALGITRKPLVFIGGINLSNLDGLLMEGAKNIAMIRAITEADDITLAARNFKDRLIKEKTGE